MELVITMIVGGVAAIFGALLGGAIAIASKKKTLEDSKTRSEIRIAHFSTIRANKILNSTESLSETELDILSEYMTDAEVELSRVLRYLESEGEK